MSSDSGIKESKVPVFSGQAEHFPIWWARFKAYGKIHGFSKCLKNAAEATLPGSAEEDANDTNDQKAARKRNDDAVLAFTLAFKTNSMMAIVLESSTSDWPDGLAHVIVKKLEDKFKPSDTIA